jgi:hypothetical protein
MAFQIRRGTNAQRLTIIPLQGELIYTTDTKELYVGDGTTTGGTAVSTGGAGEFDFGAFFITPASVDEDFGTF